MKSKLALTATTAILSAGSLAGVALTATGAPAAAATATTAAQAKKTCHTGPSTCVLKKSHPRKGTVTVKVDVFGKKKPGPLYGWDLRKGNTILCTGEVREYWKTKTKKCKNIPKGTITLNVPHRKGAAVSMSW
ncbi:MULTISPECIES: hypothetical protein [Streptomyces]|uniref:Secreted protein n=1 Tax=Streptomyces siderophoricus TaxID=2802281 RepID=A0ABS1N1W9_9ACTN|nr:hypothetical protein [Streptomyces sp. 9-7]MBL1094023.1 hypothetical protein [Streptomyces sp. 9-7]